VERKKILHDFSGEKISRCSVSSRDHERESKEEVSGNTHKIEKNDLKETFLLGEHSSTQGLHPK